MQHLAFCRAVTACFFVGFVCRYTGLFCRYTGLFFGDVEGSFADEQTPYIHRPFVAKRALQNRGSFSKETSQSRHTATHCNTLHHTATSCNTLQDTAKHCNTLQYTAIHCDLLQHTATHCNTLRHTATHCNTLQHTATHSMTKEPHCNTLNDKRALQKQSLHQRTLTMHRAYGK